MTAGSTRSTRAPSFRPGSCAARTARPVSIDGLWALQPGNGTEGGTDEVLFTAGPQDESHGLLGSLSVSD